MIPLLERCVAAYASSTAVYLLCFTPDYSRGYAASDDGFYVRSVAHPAEFVDRIETEEDALLGFTMDAASELLKILEKALDAYYTHNQHSVNPYSHKR